MTTKEQERKALEQIRKIVEGLGKDSYIATAFEGCFEDAEYNIRDDAAYSMMSRWESARTEAQKMKDQVEQQQGERKRLETKIEKLEDTVRAYEKAAAQHVETINSLKESATKHWNALQEAEAKLDEKEDEIIRLKAKLYDLMMK